MGARRGRRSAVAVTRPGLEGVCADECRELGLRIVGEGPGAVRLSVTDRDLALAVRWSRTATRMLLDLGDLHAPTFGALERSLRRVDWAAIVPPGTVPAVRVRARAARLHHTGAVEQRVLAAVAEAVGAEDPPVRADDRRDGDRSGQVRLDVVVIGDVAHVRADATGEPADRRGWRLATAKAPLPPTVAAAALRAIGWDGTVPLLDPLCGSGTIGVEAALLAAGWEPTTDRPFAVQSWPSFAAGTWASAAVPPIAGAASPAAVLLSDRDAGAVEAARGNAGRAGVGDLVAVEQHALSTASGRMADRPPGWICTNPPWGHRLGPDGGEAGDLRDLHAALGRLVIDHPGWKLAVITADPRTAQHVGVPLERLWATTVGGTRITLLASPALAD